MLFDIGFVSNDNISTPLIPWPSPYIRGRQHADWLYMSIRYGTSAHFHVLYLADPALGSTCVDLVEDCKKATSIHFLCRNKVKSKQRKQNSCTHHV